MAYKDTIQQLCDAALHPGKTVAQTQKETGKDLSADYKETAKGGLAKIHKF